MLLKLKIKDGVIQSDALEKAIKSLDGEFLVNIRQLNVEKTERDYQEQYFLMVDICVAHTGYRRYEIHEQFKEYQTKNRGLSSTRGLSLDQWRSWIEDFTWYAYNEMDCIV